MADVTRINGRSIGLHGALGVALEEALRRDKVARYAARRGEQLGLIAGGAVLVVGVVLVFAFRAPGEDPNACLREHVGFIDVKATCPESVKLERDGDVIIAYPGTSLEERRSGTRVHAGKVSILAHHRSDKKPLRVLVSHGVIEVTGTRLTVTQGEGRDKGIVRVEEGSVIFRDDDGTLVTLNAGDELGWPRPQPVVVALDAIPLASPVVSTRPTGTLASAKAVPPKKVVAEPAPAEDEEEEDEDVEEAPSVMSMEEVLKTMATLRSQKRINEAVTLLVTQSQRGDTTHAQMARLSWEIGLFVQDSGDEGAACRHWASHARKYPDDAGHAEEVRGLIRACEGSL